MKPYGWEKRNLGRWKQTKTLPRAPRRKMARRLARADVDEQTLWGPTWDEMRAEVDRTMNEWTWVRLGDISIPDER